MKRSARLLALTILAAPIFSANAGDRTLGGYIETGKRSALDDFEEESIDDDYTFQNYNLQYNDAPNEKLSYGASTFQKFRDYKVNNDLDNRTSTYNGQGAYDFADGVKQNALVGLDYYHREKRFRDSPRNDYNQNAVSPSFTWARKGLYGVTATGGLNLFKYDDAPAKDERIWYGRVQGNRYFYDGKMNLTSAYRVARTEKELSNRIQTKQDWTGEGVFKLSNPVIDKATVQVNAGQRDTKDVEEWDIDYDYRSWGAGGKVYHDIGEDSGTTLAYDYFEKNYLSYNRDNSGYSIQNEWKTAFVKNEKEKLWGSVLFGHKEVDFPLVTRGSFKKETVELKAVYWLKNAWRTTLIGDASTYDYQGSQEDKKRYNVSLTWEKLFVDRPVTLSLVGKYGYTDYRAKNDTELTSIRAVFSYSF